MVCFLELEAQKSDKVVVSFYISAKEEKKSNKIFFILVDQFSTLIVIILLAKLQYITVVTSLMWETSDSHFLPQELL